MDDVLRTVLSLSLSGSLPGALLLLCRPLYRDRLSRRWQYYIWLVVLARLLLPLSPGASPVGSLFQPAGGELSAAAEPAGEADSVPAPWTNGMPVPGAVESGWLPAVRQTGPDVRALPENLWLIWLGGALVLLVRKITIYQSFVRYVKAGCREVTDPVLLDRLAEAGESAGVGRPVELYENPLIASPMLLGFLRPCVVLPSADLPEEDFRCTALHELVHLRRRDILYKWLVQLAVCVHWFNPLVHRMAREISRACELACDEAVLGLLAPEERRAYGDTLLRALEAGGGCRSFVATVTLHESAALLKERLAAIMKFRRFSNMTNLVSLALAAMMALGAALAGAYVGPEERGPGAEGNPAVQTEPASQLERYSGGWKDEKDAMEAQQLAEYAAYGVTWDGKDCYYQGQLVNVFLDIRANKSFYTLDINPKGTVHIKIVRSGSNEITGVAYMTEAEVTALLEDREDEPDDDLEEDWQWTEGDGTAPKA